MTLTGFNLKSYKCSLVTSLREATSVRHNLTVLKLQEPEEDKNNHQKNPLKTH